MLVKYGSAITPMAIGYYTIEYSSNIVVLELNYLRERLDSGHYIRHPHVFYQSYTRIYEKKVPTYPKRPKLYLPLDTAVKINN